MKVMSYYHDDKPQAPEIHDWNGKTIEPTTAVICLFAVFDLFLSKQYAILKIYLPAFRKSMLNRQLIRLKPDERDNRGVGQYFSFT